MYRYDAHTEDNGVSDLMAPAPRPRHPRGATSTCDLCGAPIHKHPGLAQCDRVPGRSALSVDQARRVSEAGGW